MSHTDSFEKAEDVNLNDWEKFQAALGGRKGLAAAAAGLLDIALCFDEKIKAFCKGLSDEHLFAKGMIQLLMLMIDAVRTRDGTKLRLLADVVDSLGKPPLIPCGASSFQ